jgi:hypothetical protein
MIGSFIQGGLGNQLFQIAAGVSLAIKTHTDFAVIEGQHHLPLAGSPIKTYRDNILRGIKSRSQYEFSNCNTFREVGHGYKKLPLDPNLFLHGYFQSVKYFEEYTKEILDLFSCTPKIDEIIYTKYPFLKGENVTSLHIRRGDYLKFPNIHPVPDISYYYKALDLISDKGKVIVFSDDIEWCKENLKGDFIFSKFEEDYLDLYTMSKCHHHIMANSSFSWWGAWLSQTEGMVIYPKIWFGGNGPDTSKDIPLESWICL